MDDISVLRKKERNKGIWAVALWVLVTLLGGVIIGIIAAIPEIAAGNTSDFVLSTTSMAFAIFLPNSILFLVFIFMYRKTIADCFRSLDKKLCKLIAIGASITLAVNIVIGMVLTFFNVSNENQELLNTIFKEYPLISFIGFALMAPFVEEVVFRKGFSDIFRNNTVFVIVSSLLFGLIHGFSLAALLYVALGVCLSVLFIKMNKNIVAIAMVHILNNLIATLLMMLTLTS